MEWHESLYDVVKRFTRIKHLSVMKINSSMEHNSNRCQTDPTEHVQLLPIIAYHWSSGDLVSSVQTSLLFLTPTSSLCVG